MGCLDNYQIDSIDAVVRKIADGHRKIVFSLPTGAGKSVCFASLSERYLRKHNDSILILVHRKELLEQAALTLENWFGIIAEKITAKNKKPVPARVYVAMVETVNNRLKKNPDYFRNVGLLIIDECHLHNFNKVHEYFPGLIVGVTATAKNASKTFPLKTHYDTIAVGVDIPYLIDFHSRNPKRGLVPCLTYAPENVRRNDLHSGSGPDGFDQSEMAATYSSTRHVNNTVEKYKSHARGKKTLVFNCNVAHSILVCEAFLNAGFNARHLDGEHDTEARREILDWFRSTPDAILCSVGILTTGFDEPSIEAVIVNKSTKSLPLWLQMCGRGGRPFDGKDYFIIIDMGDNVTYHLEWSEPRDWDWIFNNPDKPKPKDSGVAPIKICINLACERIIPAQATVCKYCGTLQPIPEQSYDDKLGEFVLVTKGIDVAGIISRTKDLLKQDGSAYNPYSVLHTIKDQVINTFAGSFRGRKIDAKAADKIMEAFQLRVSEWCKETGKKYNAFHKTAPSEWLLAALKEKYGYEPEKLNLDIPEFVVS